MVRVAELIDRALTHPDEATLARVKADVEELTVRLPALRLGEARRAGAADRLSSGAVDRSDRTAVCR